ncbi:MAG: hypothetical protein BGO69_13055 [Bacteroidetes bacterium 46-16]|nr:MAG: hypothetical protein BGO69_13055 [Bacteroidetes bacterium 46-16]
MKKRYNKILLTAIATIFAFVSVTYVSCIKVDDKPYSCDYHACLNGGICYKGTCNCPAGYDSVYCNTMWIDKYPGKWAVSEVIKGSSHPWRVGMDSAFAIVVRKGGTNTSLLIDSFMNNWYYHDIPVQITTSTTIMFSPYFCPYNTTPAFSISGGDGVMDASYKTIQGTYYRRIQDSVSTANDTVDYTMTKL